MSLINDIFLYCLPSKLPLLLVQCPKETLQPGCWKYWHTLSQNKWIRYHGGFLLCFAWVWLGSCGQENATSALTLRRRLARRLLSNKSLWSTINDLLLWRKDLDWRRRWRFTEEASNKLGVEKEEGFARLAWREQSRFALFARILCPYHSICGICQPFHYFY